MSSPCCVRKLPAELLTSDDSFDPANPEFLKEALEDIKELLVNRLLSTENAS